MKAPPEGGAGDVRIEELNHPSSITRRRPPQPEPPPNFDPSKYPIISRHFFGLGVPIVERCHDPEQGPEVRAA